MGGKRIYSNSSFPYFLLEGDFSYQIRANGLYNIKITPQRATQLLQLTVPSYADDIII